MDEDVSAVITSNEAVTLDRGAPNAQARRRGEGYAARGDPGIRDPPAGERSSDRRDRARRSPATSTRPGAVERGSGGGLDALAPGAASAR